MQEEVTAGGLAWPLPGPAAASPASEGSGRRRLRPHWTATLLTLLVVWCTVLWSVYADQAQRRQAEASRVLLNAKGFSEYVSLQMATIDRLLRHTRRQFERTGVLPTQGELAAELGPLAPLLLQVAVARTDGTVIASSLPLNVGVSIADRPHFRVFTRDARDRLHLSAPVTGRVSGKMSLQMVRPLAPEAGGFRGVIVASFDPLRLQKYFDSLDAFSDGGSVAIVGREDAVVRVRFTEDGISWGQSLQRSTGWHQISTRVSGNFNEVGVIDGQPRSIGFHQVSGYPLAVAATLPSRPFYAQLRPRTLLLLGLAAAFSVTLVILSVRRDRQERSRERVVQVLQESTRREAEANQLKTNFLASVSHDLRTPLNSILGFSELVRDSATAADIKRFGGLIHESAKHLHALVDTLLDLAKIEAGRLDLHWEELDLRALLSTIAQVHLVSAEQKGLTLSLTVPEAPMQLVTDRTRLTQVLNNLLHNAVKFTKTGAIWLSAEVRGDDVRIRVIDTGVGIAADRLRLAFQRFSLLGSEPGANHGAGLGLALSRELVELLGGRISITSAPWVGTEIEIVLPSRRR